MLESYRKSVNNNNTNTCQLQEFETSSILYLVNYLTDPNSWSVFCYPISIFSTNGFMEIITKNITTFLYKITFLIRNRNFYSKTEKDILDILGFG